MIARVDAPIMAVIISICKLSFKIVFQEQSYSRLHQDRVLHEITFVPLSPMPALGALSKMFTYEGGAG